MGETKFQQQALLSIVSGPPVMQLPLVSVEPRDKRESKDHDAPSSSPMHTHAT